MICDICQEDLLEEKINTYKTECNHIFHKECIKSWINTLNNKNELSTCPMCRYDLQIKFIKFKMTL